MEGSIYKRRLVLPCHSTTSTSQQSFNNPSTYPLLVSKISWKFRQQASVLLPDMTVQCRSTGLPFVPHSCFTIQCVIIGDLHPNHPRMWRSLWIFRLSTGREDRHLPWYLHRDMGKFWLFFSWQAWTLYGCKWKRPGAWALLQLVVCDGLHDTVSDQCAGESTASEASSHGLGRMAVVCCLAAPEQHPWYGWGRWSRGLWVTFSAFVFTHPERRVGDDMPLCQPDKMWVSNPVKSEHKPYRKW